MPDYDGLALALFMLAALPPLTIIIIGTLAAAVLPRLSISEGIGLGILTGILTFAATALWVYLNFRWDDSSISTGIFKTYDFPRWLNYMVKLVIPYSIGTAIMLAFMVRLNLYRREPTADA